MKIQNFKSQSNGSRSRISAEIRWEDSDRAGVDAHFETDIEFADALFLGLEPFLTACAIPAMHHQEKRVSVEGKICPELRHNLITAMYWIRHWYYDRDRRLPEIEADLRPVPIDNPLNRRTGFFLSGGIDCLATLAYNHQNYPPGHPGCIRDGVLIYGQNIESDTREETFRQAIQDLGNLAAEKAVTLIPVYTNIRLVDDGSEMFDMNHGAILGSVAQAFSRRLSCVYVSSSDSIPGLSLVNRYNFKPHGSHPVLDPLYGSYHLKIKHDGIISSRLDKIRLISGWDSALRQIRVCGPNWPGKNCCKCEKCVRTMLGLLAAGVLQKSSAFPTGDVTEDMIAEIHIKRPKFGYSTDDDYRELILPLKAIGRNDLALAVEKMIDRSFYPGRTLRQKIRRLDQKFLGGTLGDLKNHVKRINPLNSFIK
jgi:hypothetical protein